VKTSRFILATSDPYTDACRALVAGERITRRSPGSRRFVAWRDGVELYTALSGPADALRALVETRVAS